MRMKTQDICRAHEPGLVVGMVTGCEVPLLMCSDIEWYLCENFTIYNILC